VLLLLPIRGECTLNILERRIIYMKKILLVVMGIMLISGLFLVSVQADETTQGEESVTESAGYGEEAAPEEGEKAAPEEGEEAAPEAGGYDEEKPSEAESK
jgi:hypothetical protein